MRLALYKGFYSSHTLRRVWWSRARDAPSCNEDKGGIQRQPHTNQYYVSDAYAQRHPHCTACDSNCPSPVPPSNGTHKKELKKTKGCRSVKTDNHHWNRMDVTRRS